MTSLERFYEIIKKPLITEKATDDSSANNSYHFRVPTNANKVEIRQAVEKLFDVRVLNINTMRIKGKWRRRGHTTGLTQEWKKAMITLAEGQTIDIL
ncbi:MAG: 50S ribosomal protein L23 [Planctomycetota bacterium]|nr:50S ribosomal protein L23 [Planctomycetota bacterium]